MPRRIRADEKRNPIYRGAGTAMAALLGALFVTVFGLALHQRSAWRESFFRDTIDAGTSCVAGAWSAADGAEQPAPVALLPLALPHAPGALAVQGGGAYHQARYHCEVAGPFVPATGAAYLHLGWVFAESARVEVNGTLRASFRGNDKASILLTSEDFTGPRLAFDVWLAAPSGARYGLIGAQPLAIARSTNVNARILGIETALQVTGNLYHLLPALSLGLVLVLGWAFGLRMRLMVAALFFFLCSAARTTLGLLADVWPWGLEVTHLVQLPLNLAVGPAFLLFGMELLRIGRRAINRLMAVVVLTVPALLMALLLVSEPFVLVSWAVTAYRLGCAVGAGACLVFGLRAMRAAELDREHRAIRGAFLVLCGLFGAAMLADEVFAGLGLLLRLAPNVDILMPLFVGGILFFALAVLERRYQDERLAREVLLSRLELGRAVQRLLLPREMKGAFGGFHFQSLYKPSEQMSGDWLYHWRVDEREVRLLIGDVAGKGPQAALAAAVIFTMLNDCKRRRMPLDATIRRVNEELLEVFTQHVSTTLSAVVLKDGRAVELYNCGNAGWIHVARGVASHHAIPGSLLGVSREPTIGRQTLLVSPGDLLLAYTDGVCDGPRALRKLLLTLKEQAEAGPLDIDRLFAVATSAGHESNPDDDQALIAVRAA